LQKLRKGCTSPIPGGPGGDALQGGAGNDFIEAKDDPRRDGQSAEATMKALAPAESGLRQQRVQARRGMLKALDSNRYERLIANFSATLRRGRSPTPTSPILEAAPHLLRDRYKKVRKVANTLREDSPPEHFHDLRKKGKRLRYALEPLQEIYGKPAKKMVKLLKNMQDDLGDHQDLIVACGLMEELGVAGDRQPKVVFWMGTMSEGYLSEASKIRSGFLGSKSLRTLKDGKEWKKLRKTLEKRAGG
jgi:triphosphatase